MTPIFLSLTDAITNSKIYLNANYIVELLTTSYNTTLVVLRNGALRDDSKRQVREVIESIDEILCKLACEN
jgi:hypothetical protein